LFCFIFLLFSVSDDDWPSFEEVLSQAAGQHEGLDRVFRKHIKPKKQHEIARLCEVIRSALVFIVLLVLLVVLV
jgi:hypothetical protein